MIDTLGGLPRLLERPCSAATRRPPRASGSARRARFSPPVPACGSSRPPAAPRSPVAECSRPFEAGQHAAFRVMRIRSRNFTAKRATRARTSARCLAAAAQRRQMERHHVQTIVQISAKRPASLVSSRFQFVAAMMRPCRIASRCCRSVRIRRSRSRARGSPELRPRASILPSNSVLADGGEFADLGRVGSVNAPLAWPKNSLDQVRAARRN